MTYRSLRLLALVALLAVPPFGAGQQVAAQTSPPRFILCAPAAAVAGIAQRHGLTVVRPVDQHAHDVFLVTGPTGVATPDLLSIVRSDTAVINFEPDTTRTLTETGFGLNQSTVAILDQSTVAILDALTDRTLSPFGDADVWNAYINQPAATIIKLPEAHEQFGTGTGVIALIDEGVDPNHGLLVPALVPGYDFLRNLPGIASEWLDLNQKLISQLTQSTVAILDQSTVAILDGSSPAVLNQSTVAILDQSTVAILDTTQVPASFGHGTMMAGVIRRVAPGANIMPLKAFKADGTANLFDVIRAIYYAVDNGARVIVMGFSMPETSVELAHAINFATSKGVTAVAAAGNDGRETIVFPAALRNVVGVGSTTYTDQRSVFSNFGDSLVKVAAPGEAIITSYPGLRYAAASGTSFSAALVGGAVALMQSVGWHRQRRPRRDEHVEARSRPVECARGAQRARRAGDRSAAGAGTEPGAGCRERHGHGCGRHVARDRRACERCRRRWRCADRVGRHDAHARHGGSRHGRSGFGPGDLYAGRQLHRCGRLHLHDHRRPCHRDRGGDRDGDGTKRYSSRDRRRG
jgi:hypothetical protein